VPATREKGSVQSAKGRKSNWLRELEAEDGKAIEITRGIADAITGPERKGRTETGTSSAG